MQPRYHFWLQSYYSAQSRAPWFHSWYNPNNKIIRKIKAVIAHDWILQKWRIDAIGSKRVISTSKIKKITAIRKNRKEKGSRAVPLGSNPHSNGEFFSRSEITFLDKIDAIIITKVEINKIIEIEMNKIMIVSFKFYT